MAATIYYVPNTNGMTIEEYKISADRLTFDYMEELAEAMGWLDVSFCKEYLIDKGWVKRGEK